MNLNILQLLLYFKIHRFDRFIINVEDIISLKCKYVYTYMCPDALFFKNADGTYAYFDGIKNITLNESNEEVVIDAEYGLEDKKIKIICKNA